MLRQTRSWSQFQRKIRIRFTLVLLMLVGVTLFSTMGFVIIEGIGPFEAFYMAVITFTTVGYGDMVPHSLTGRLFSILTILLGLTGSGVSIALLVDLFFEKTLIDMFKGHKLGKQLLKFKDHFIVCGYGVTGSCITKTLLANGQQVVVIEKKPLELEENQNLIVVEGDARKDEILIDAAIERAKGLASTLTEDADNVFVVLTARALNGALEIVSRFKDDDTEKKLLSAGANHAVSPYRMGAHRLTLALTSPAMASMVDHALHTTKASIAFCEVALPEAYRQRETSLSAAKAIAKELGLLLVAAFDEEGQPVFNPDSAFPCATVERLLMLGPPRQNDVYCERIQASG